MADQRICDVPLLPAGVPHPRLVFAARRVDDTIVECRRIVCLVGSRPGCKVLLPHDHVDGVHAAILFNGENWLALDLVTRYGTTLNDLALGLEKLSHADCVGIGPWKCQVQIPQSQNGKVETSPFGLEPTPQLIALEHVASQRILQPHRAACIIGRRPGCDVVVSDNAVSRVHAILFTFYGFPAILDLLTPNQTFVNDEPAGFRMLRDNDVIRVGDSKFRVRLAAPTVGQKVLKSSTASASGVTPPGTDLVDIKATEGSQRWNIVDNLQKASRGR